MPTGSAMLKNSHNDDFMDEYVKTVEFLIIRVLDNIRLMIDTHLHGEQETIALLDSVETMYQYNG